MPAGHLLVIMGSGETSPTMVTLHKELVASLSPPLRPGEAVLLETPYGFQENADELSARAQGYFAGSVGLRVAAPAGLRAPAGQAATSADTDRGLAAVQAARWLFAGPGSPSYALAQWRGSALADVLVRHLGGAGVTIFSSAAACTVGRFALPVYEVYKVGAPPVWLDGLDLTGRLGLDAAVIPHFDNTEGGTHDTRFCYMGERRLALLEDQLPASTGILGVDEHTAAVLDLAGGTLTVSGRGTVTARYRGHTTSLPAGARVGLGELAALLSGAGGSGEAGVVQSDVVVVAPAERKTLPEGVAGCERAFEEAVAGGDAGGMAGAILELDRLIVAWSADTLQSDELDRAHAALRGLVVRLGDAAERGLLGPGALLGPAVEPLLALRHRLRTDGSFALADVVRDALAGAGITLRDTPAGTDWDVAGS
ncbi:MAG: type 1 glutamine amidotransferase family protein [Mycobacteriales bacterium]